MYKTQVFLHVVVFYNSQNLDHQARLFSLLYHNIISLSQTPFFSVQDVVMLKIYTLDSIIHAQLKGFEIKKNSKNYIICFKITLTFYLQLRMTKNQGYQKDTREKSTKMEILREVMSVTYLRIEVEGSRQRDRPRKKWSIVIYKRRT